VTEKNEREFVVKFENEIWYFRTNNMTRRDSWVALLRNCMRDVSTAEATQANANLQNIRQQLVNLSEQFQVFQRRAEGRDSQLLAKRSQESLLVEYLQSENKQLSKVYFSHYFTFLLCLYK